MSGVRRKFQRMAGAGPLKTGEMLWRRTQRRLHRIAQPPSGARALAEIASKSHSGPGIAGIERFPFGAPLVSDPVQTADLCKKVFPESVLRTIELATSASENSFHLLGRSITFHDKVNWFWCPETGRSWPDDPELSLSDGFYNAPDRPGDIKFPWELNRHQFFIPLAQAWHYTGDERYVRAVIEFVTDWRARNPVARGINWYSAMEVAIRIISWSTALFLLRDSDLFRLRGLRPMLEGLYEHAAHLSRNLTLDWLVPNNHIIGEAAGLWLFGVLFPIFEESPRWRNHALQILEKQFPEQVCEDGANLEQSTGYHRFVLDFLGIVVLAARRNKIELPQLLAQRFEAMVTYQHHLLPANQHPPQVGDCDDGRGIVFGAPETPHDYRSWLCVGAALLQRPELKNHTGHGNEEAIWILGANDWTLFEELAPDHSPTTSVLFANAGHAILRGGMHEREIYVFMRCGPFGLGENGACSHSHADLLAPVVVWFGQTLFQDSGTYSYLTDDALRSQFRCTAAHNTLGPIGVEQATPYPIWDWRNVPRARVLEWRDVPDSIRITAEMLSPNGYTHRRSLRLDRKNPVLEIEDKLTLRNPNRGRTINAFFHLAPSLEAVGTHSATIRIVQNIEQRPLCDITYEGFDSYSIAPCSISPRYGVKLDASCIIFNGAGPVLSSRVRIVPPSPTNPH